jgi:hypothetical protein
MLEGGQERPVRRTHDGVTPAVEDQDAVSRRLVGELPNEAALPDARLATE